MNQNRPDNNGNNNNNNNNNNGSGGSGRSFLWIIMVVLLILLIVSTFTNRMNNLTTEEISYSEFVSMVEEGKVESVVITSASSGSYGEIELTLTEEEIANSAYEVSYYTINVGDERLYEMLDEYGVEYTGKNSSSNTFLISMLSFLIPIILIWVIFYFVMRRMSGGAGGGGGGIMGIGKSTAKMYVEKSTGVDFSDVAGQDEAKETLQEMVDFLNNPRKYTDIGAKLPKGALLVGPPGTGKTLLAKAVAGEAGVPFFSLAGSDFVEMYVGVGASRVRDLFKEAQKQSPCIIFIDEVDAIGKTRDSRFGGGNDEREQTLNQLLAEMDGFDSSKGVLILAATNRPEVLDKALLRPGRFDRRVIVDRPDLKGRLDTLKVHSRNVLMDETVDLEALALATAGCVGSDLANMVNEAAINAVKHGRKYVSQEDLFESVETVIAGKEKKDRIMGPKEKRMVAYHEVGHALVSALQKDSEPVQKITIVPRTMGSLGYTLQTPEEEKYLETRAELEARLVTYMGGRAAEEIKCDSVSTGAANDIEQATNIARAMVTRLGMSDEFGLMAMETVESQYLDGRAMPTVAESTVAKVDEVVKAMLQKAYDTAKQMLYANIDILERIAEYLFERETITGKEFMNLFNEMRAARSPMALEAYIMEEEPVNVVEHEDDVFETVSDPKPAQETKVEEDGRTVSYGTDVAPEEAFDE